jgi:hypothetical protein
MKTEITKALRQSAKKSTCLRTGKASWTVDVNGFHFTVVKGRFRGPGVDIYGGIKNTRKELVSCITHFYNNDQLEEMAMM